jgi:hypothetical protein
MFDTASGWLMTSLSADPLAVSLVQVAVSLPLFLFTLLGGRARRRHWLPTAADPRRIPHRRGVRGLCGVGFLLVADDALVNDQLRDYWGKPAIREWAARDIIGASLNMDVTNVIEHYGNFIVTANVSGNLIWQGYQNGSYTPFTFRLMATGLFSWSFSATDATFESGRSTVAGALGHQLPRHFAAGARNAPISQKARQFYKSTSRRGSLCLSPAD